MSTKTIGVLGAGVMGKGVAQNLAQTNHNVILIDISENILDKAKSDIANSIRFQGFFSKNKNQEGHEKTLERIVFTKDYSCLEKADFVIENVIEKWDIKEKIYNEIDQICNKDCIFSSNTSAISITRIASATKRPTQIIGTHFMNPVPLKNMVEVIRAYHTSDKTIETTKKLLAQMGKECVVVNDMPGFVSNRVLMLTVNEAIFLVMDGVACAEDVDKIFKSCFGHKMGPLETADLIGLDTILYSLDVLYESYNDSKYRPCPLLKKMVDAGLHGQKNGKGFYNYD
ncbi:secreted protein containing 3-hydroxyacyl-CoA dehydrogenase, NAD binding [Candidatus Magnetomorum sp. HK-1]|nr:secreted protein containing 3-hydroxyacyl-CoA dehydrogenase, NAD binding [Candidatus Magnetomorum sp. HK-1]